MGEEVFFPFLTFSQVWLIGLDNQQPSNTVTAYKKWNMGWVAALPTRKKPATQNKQSKITNWFGLTILFAVGGFWTNVGNPTIYPPGKLPTLLTVIIVIILQILSHFVWPKVITVSNFNQLNLFVNEQRYVISKNLFRSKITIKINYV